MPDAPEILDRIDILAPERRQALLRVLTTRGRDFGVFPLSAAQRRLWFLSRLHPGIPLYNVGYGFRIGGPLDADLLRQALTGLVSRHDALRTAFFDIDGEPFQIVRPDAALATRISRWNGAGDADLVARRLLDTEARRPFDLSRAPLVRATVVQLGEQDSLLLLTLHHIVCDGWSMTVVLSELGELYTAARDGAPFPLPPLTCQYSDYVQWETEQEASEDRQRQLRYWTAQLAGAPASLTLPTDHPRPPVQSLRGAQAEFSWPASFSGPLEASCASWGVTPFVVIMTGLSAVLRRWARQDDVLIGVPVASRGQLRFEGLTGVFINTVVMRARMSAAMTFRELMYEVRETSIGALTHQEFPFERVVEVLAPERSPDRTTLFQVSFAIQDADSIELRLPGLRTHYMQGDTGTAKFDFTLSIWPTATGLRGTCEYSTTLFEPATIRCFITSLRELITAAMADPDQPLSELPVPVSVWRQGDSP